MVKEKELILKLIEKRKAEKNEIYQLLQNTKAANVELFLINTSSQQGLKAYYREKEFVSLLDCVDIGTLLEYLKEKSLTDYDVIFLSHIDYLDFFLVCRFLTQFTGVRTTIPDSKHRARMESNGYKIVDEIKKKVEEGDQTLTLFDQLRLGDHLEEILTYAKENNLSLTIES